MTLAIKLHSLIPGILVGYSILFGLLKFKSAWLSPPLYFLLCSLGVLITYPNVLKNLLKKVRPYDLLIGIALGLLPVFVHYSGVMSVKYSLLTWVNLLIFAPLGEELYFRGLLQQHLTQRSPTWVAIVLQALLFMFCHASWALGPLCLGLLNGLIISKRNDIRACILIHVFQIYMGLSRSLIFQNCFKS